MKIEYTGSNEWVGLNLHSVICFKPTEAAQEILYQDYGVTEEMKQDPLYKLPYANDEEGYHYFTFYRFIEIFGPHLSKMPLGRIATDDEVFVTQQMDYGAGKLIRTNDGFREVGREHK